MDRQFKEQLSKELEQFYCSILLSDMRECVKKLRTYGIKNSEIEVVLYEKVRLPHLIIKHNYKIMIAGKRKMEITMEPLVKAVYFLFLKHPEGIVFKHLPDYREELTEIYKQLRPLGMSQRAKQSIEDVTNPLKNSINEKCARIRSAFEQKFDEHLAKNYFITGERGMAKGIALPRDLVTWE